MVLVRDTKVDRLSIQACCRRSSPIDGTPSRHYQLNSFPVDFPSEALSVRYRLMNYHCTQ